MNTRTCSSLITLTVLAIPIIITPTNIYTSKNYPSHTNNIVTLAFIISTIPAIIFVYSKKQLFLTDTE